jgi:hypothetical protein
VAVQRLTATPPARSGRQAAYLTGSAVARAVGSFGYRYFPDGTAAPDVQWVAANIRTEPVPLLGRVTCHRAMLPRPRGALEEVDRTGLATAIDPSDGTVAQIDRRVVAVLARWGFAWGGTWRWTDPMHFELAALVGVP